MTAPRRRWFQFSMRTLLASMTVAAAFVAWVAWERREGEPIEFVVPDGFHGTIEIIRDRTGGDDLTFNQGKYVFVVPSSGLIRVKEAFLFHRWHTESCREVSGKPRNLKDEGASAGSQSTGPNSRIGSTDYDGTTYRWEVN